MSSWWSIRHPLLINCLTTSKWPSPDAFWSAVWPVWKKVKKTKLKKAFVLSNVLSFFVLWSSFLADHHLSLTTSIVYITLGCIQNWSIRSIFEQIQLIFLVLYGNQFYLNNYRIQFTTTKILQMIWSIRFGHTQSIT